jgi:hypothetical protein
VEFPKRAKPNLNHLAIVSFNAIINFCLNGLSFLLIVRNLNEFEIAKYLHYMALIPILGTLSSSFQQVTALKTSTDEIEEKLRYVYFCLRKSAPFFAISFLVIGLLTPRLPDINLFILCIILLYLPFSFVISGLFGLFQRNQWNLKWQLYSILENVFRLILVYIFSVTFNSAIGMYLAVVGSIGVVSLLVIVTLDPKKFSINPHMRSKKQISTLRLATFAALVQADILIAPLVLSKEVAFKYLFVSNLVKLMYGVLYVYSQMVSSEDKSNFPRKKTFLGNPTLVISSIWIIALIVVNLVPEVTVSIIEFVLQKNFDVDFMVLNTLILNNCLLSLCLIRTFQRVREGKSTIIPTLLALALLFFGSNFVLLSPVTFAFLHFLSITIYVIFTSPTLEKVSFGNWKPFA